MRSPERGAFLILAPVEVLAKSRRFLRRFSIAPNPLRWAQRSSLCKLARITLPRVDATTCCALRRFAPCRIPPCPPQLQRRRKASLHAFGRLTRPMACKGQKRFMIRLVHCSFGEGERGASYGGSRAPSLLLTTCPAITFSESG